MPPGLSVGLNTQNTFECPLVSVQLPGGLSVFVLSEFLRQFCVDAEVDALVLLQIPQVLHTLLEQLHTDTHKWTESGAGLWMCVCV